MKEEVTLMSLGSQEENGSMYPMLVNSLWEENTKNRTYFIANELAQIEGESFTMPEKSKKYGLFVDNQGTDCKRTGNHSLQQKSQKYQSKWCRCKTDYQDQCKFRCFQRLERR